MISLGTCDPSVSSDDLTAHRVQDKWLTAIVAPSERGNPLRDEGKWVGRTPLVPGGLQRPWTQ